LSHPDLPWPVRKVRRRRRQQAHLSAEPVELPTNPAASDAATLRPETPETSHPTSEQEESTNPTTPSSLQHPSLSTPAEATLVTPKPSQRSTVPAVPVIPAVPKAVSKDTAKPVSEKAHDVSKSQQSDIPEAEQNGDENSTSDHPSTEELKDAPPPSNAWATPKLWTGLFNPASAGAAGAKNGTRAAASANFGKTNAETLAEALRSFSAVANDSKVTFLEPRGLVNTGNMCYMNSVCWSKLAECYILTAL
jgi:ubiquitin carboxyl-terminal hydrolase 10